MKPSLSGVSLHAGNTNKDTQPTPAQVLDKDTSESLTDGRSPDFYFKLNHQLRPLLLPTYVLDGIPETKFSMQF